MQKKFFIIASLLVFTLIFTTGCGVKINGKDYNLFSTEKDDKADFAFGFASESEDSQKISEDRQDSEQLLIDSDSGNISVEKSKSGKIEVEIEKKVRGGSAEDKKKLLENMNIKFERTGKSIRLNVLAKNGEDFWKWKKDTYKPIQVSINYDILLPDGITAIETKMGAGNIEVDDITAKLSVQTGAGNIDINNVNVMTDSQFNTGAGNIDFSGKFDNVSSFDASTGVGNINFEVPEDTKFSLDVHTGIGNLSGSFIEERSDDKFNFKGDINGGGPVVKLNTGVGNVDADRN